MAEVRAIDSNELRKKEREMDMCQAVTVWDIDDAPTISPESLRPKGRWLYDSLGSPATYRICSHCVSSFKYFGGDGQWKTCPVCSADMRGDAMFE